MAHDEILPDCRELFGEIKTKLDFLIDANKNKSCDMEKHIADSIDYRKTVDRHDLQLKEYSSIKRTFQAAMFTIIGGVAVWLISWGMTLKQIDVNTSRLCELEKINPRHSITETIDSQAQAAEQKK